MRNTLFAVLVGALALASAPARAQDAETIADVRCVIVGLLLVQKTDANQRSSGQMLSMYYIGRLDGRVPKLDLEELLIREGNSMTESDINSEAIRCGASLRDKGQEIVRIGKDIIEKSQSQQK